MLLAHRLSLKFHSFLEACLAINCLFFGQSFSLGHYSAKYQPLDGIYLLIISLTVNQLTAMKEVRLIGPKSHLSVYLDVVEGFLTSSLFIETLIFFLQAALTSNI